MLKIIFYLLLYSFPLLAQNFILSTDIVIDTDTALIWERSGKLKKNWDDALSYCDGTVQGITGWHLPNVNEIQTIINYNRNRPAIDTNIFTDFNESKYYYWTSTISLVNQDYAYCARIGIEGKITNCKRSDEYYLICVKPR